MSRRRPPDLMRSTDVQGRDPATGRILAPACRPEPTAVDRPTPLPWADRVRAQPSLRVLLGLGPRWWGVVDEERIAERATQGTTYSVFAFLRPFRVLEDHWIRLVDGADDGHVGWIRIGARQAELVRQAGVVAIHGGPGRTVRRRVAVSGDFPTFRAWAFPRTQKWFVG